MPETRDEALMPAREEPEGDDATYMVSVWCKNCGETEVAHIPRGQPIDQRACTHCGVKALQRRI